MSEEKTTNPKTQPKKEGKVMETTKQFINTMLSKSNSIIEEGDIRRYNYITANFMMGLMANVILLFTLLTAILNQFNIFTADKTSMWVLCIFAAVLIIPMQIVMRINKGEMKNMHWYLLIDLILVCGGLTVLLGHNVVLLMVLPVVLSVRYYDYKFTGKIALVTVVLAVLFSATTAMTGVLNLNMCTNLIKDTTLVVTDGLRQAIEPLIRGVEGGQTGNILAALNPDVINSEMFRKYVVSLFLNDMLPRLLIFTVVAIACAQIAKRGDEMLTLQQQAGEKQARIEGELNVATEIQNSMLPCIFPAFPEHQNLELYATYIPAKEVGGDFYDYFNIDKDHIAVVMADVSGKGVGAALFMTIAKIVLKNQLMAGLEPKDAVSEANRQLCENNDAGLFVTGWIGVYQISTCQMTFVNAGHNPPIIRRKDGKIDYLCERNGFVMAGYDATKYTQSTVDLNQGDEIFLYTDGVTEANNIKEDFYGEDRLIKVVEENYGKDVQEQLKAIAGDINDFIGEAEQFDDITMMVLKVK